MDMYVGHFGCPARDGLVKVGTRREDKPRFNEVADVGPCPACGGRHDGRPMWRAARPGEWALVEAVLP